MRAADLNAFGHEHIRPAEMTEHGDAVSRAQLPQANVAAAAGVRPLRVDHDDTSSLRSQTEGLTPMIDGRDDSADRPLTRCARRDALDHIDPAYIEPAPLLLSDDDDTIADLEVRRTKDSAGVINGNAGGSEKSDGRTSRRDPEIASRPRHSSVNFNLASTRCLPPALHGD